MAYEAPRFEEIKMDAEVGSYQEDFEFDPNFDPVVPQAHRAQPATHHAKPAAHHTRPAAHHTRPAAHHTRPAAQSAQHNA